MYFAPLTTVRGRTVFFKKKLTLRICTARTQYSVVYHGFVTAGTVGLVHVVVIANNQSNENRQISTLPLAQKTMKGFR